MQHLNELELARLADEEPTGDEAVHLSLCEQCRIELEDLRAQIDELAGLPELVPSAGSWSRLRQRLAAEDLIDRQDRRVGLRWLGGVAAALALFLGGAATGAAVVRETTPAVETLLLPATPAETVRELAAAPVTEASPVAEFPERDEIPLTAAERLRHAESEYFVALEAYALANPPAVAVDPLNRLAALEGIVLTTRAALEEAPTDPVINGYLMSAIGQREAILRQINSAPSSGEQQEDGWY